MIQFQLCSCPHSIVTHVLLILNVYGGVVSVLLLLGVRDWMRMMLQIDGLLFIIIYYVNIIRCLVGHFKE